MPFWAHQYRFLMDPLVFLLGTGRPKRPTYPPFCRFFVDFLTHKMMFNIYKLTIQKDNIWLGMHNLKKYISQTIMEISAFKAGVGPKRPFLNQNQTNLVFSHIVPRGTANIMPFIKI